MNLSNYKKTNFRTKIQKITTSCLLIASFLSIGCSQSLTPLGDGSLAGVLPEKWENAPIDDNEIIRVIKPWIPVSWEIVIYPASKDTIPPKDKDWAYIKEEKHPEPGIRIGDKIKTYTRMVRIYRARLSDARLLEAAVDTRFDKSQAEKCLRSLKPAS